ncbi:MAG: hypothetical protein VKJ24_19270 [Synechococcales bacterium]|nr:hypothetical protein [Synechococcales bacterium]
MTTPTDRLTSPLSLSSEPEPEPSMPQWYIVKQAAGFCQITPDRPSEPLSESSSESAPSPPQYWGPFSSQAEAIARRVGLIRAGKCQPQ